MKYKKYFGFSSKLALIMYIALILYYIFCWYNMMIVQDGAENHRWNKEHYNGCINYLSSKTEEEKNSIITQYYYLEFDDDICNSVTSYGAPPNSSLNVFAEFFSDERFLFPFFVPIIVLLPFLYLISREMKNKTIKNYCLRKEYNKYIKYIFKQAYRNVFIFPLLVFITLIISYIISNGNTNIATDVGLNFILPNVLFISKPIFPLIYAIVLFLGAGLYINIGLIVLSKNKNFIVSMLESELIIFLVWCFSYILFGNFFKQFSINPDNFNLLNLYNWAGVDNMYVFLGVNLFLFIVSFVLAILSYRNKEKILTMCEK